MARSPKTLQLLVNPNAGPRRVNAVIQAAGAAFAAPRWRLLVKVLSGPEEAYVLARRSARRGHHAVLAAGGDGTVNEVARGLLGRATRLGVIPCGTGNGFARALGMPLGLWAACAALAQAREARVDAGYIDRQRVFVNVCGLGFDAWIARQANAWRWLGRVSGFLRYFASGLLGALLYRPPLVRLRAGRRRWQGRALLVAVCNSEQYGFGTRIAPGARMDDGAFDVVVVPPMAFFTMLFRGLRLLGPGGVPGALRFRARRLSLAAAAGSDAPLHLDGEHSGAAPVEIRIMPKALSVLLPPAPSNF